MEKESIVSAANRILNGPSDMPDAVPGKEKVCRDGLYIWTEESYAASRSAGGKLFTAPDGYIRKTPEQKLRIPREYRNKRRRRIVSRLILLVVLILIIYIAVNYGNF
ncbi:MAG: hypothetical protein IJG63_05525 [Oscillospiraceae bacterium]|nr:hypothetical protein [Oscillospiraceae bacterium]